MQFKIPLVPVSKKNSQRIVNAGGRYILLPSKKYTDYEEQAGYFIPKPVKPLQGPLNIKCLFYMPTKRRCDLTNMLEAIDDVLVKYRVIEDDNYNVIASHDGSRVLYDNRNPRTEVEILNFEDYRQEIEGLLRENERLNMVLESYRISLENIGRMKNYAVEE